MSPRPIALCLFLGAAGCGVSFPDRSRIEDLRILDISLEPPEMPALSPGTTASTAAALARLLRDAPNLEEVHLTALVAHPDLDAELEYHWVGCAPDLGGLPCTRSRRVDLSNSVTASTASFRPIELLEELLLATGDPAGALRVVAADPRDLLNGLYAQVILRASVGSAQVPVDTSELDAAKRLVIFDPALVRVAIAEARRQAATGEVPDLSALGLPTLCTRATEEEVGLIEAFLHDRARNNAPHFLGIEASVRGATVSVDRPVELEPGEPLDLEGLALAEDREAYMLIDDNCQLVKRREVLAWSWFTTAGSVSSAITVWNDSDDPAHRRTRFTAPPYAAVAHQDGRLRIYSVLRDGRGGSRHRTLDVQVLHGP